ncbi:MAG: 2'-5' RNA ligase family protein [Myxococcota bacterium]
MSRENWFFGFPLDGAFMRSLPAPPHGFRLYHPDDIHLTLAFLGGCGEAPALRALEALDGELEQAQLSSIDVSLGAVQPMGSRRAYTALSAVLDIGREAVEVYIARLRDALADAASVARDTRPPKAHATLARPARRASHAERQAGLVWARGLDLTHVNQRIRCIALYRWSENRNERLFRVVARRELGGVAADAG